MLGLAADLHSLDDLIPKPLVLLICQRELVSSLTKNYNELIIPQFNYDIAHLAVPCASLGFNDVDWSRLSRSVVSFIDSRIFGYFLAHSKRILSKDRPKNG